MSPQPEAPTDITVTEAWINFMRFCYQEFPHGEITIKIVNSQPMDVINYKPKINFGKKQTIPKTGRIVPE